MANYIDAEKLNFLIDNKLEDLGTSGSVWVGRSVLCELKDEVKSLQQEQSEESVLADLEEAARHSEILNYPMPEDGDIEKVFKVQEARVFHEIGFIAGAKWQKQHDAELIEIAYNDGITIGMTKQKEQMMMEAVEGEVENASFGIVYLRKNLTNDGYSTGDKVRIIICKKED